MGGVKELYAAVHARDLCCRCGACVNLCPYLFQVGGRIAPLLDCQLAEGRCYHYCPRTAVTAASQTAALGTLVLPPAMARAVAPAAGQQYGGTVSALIRFALESGRIDGAVLTAAAGLQPRSVTVRQAAQIDGCAGSKYTISPTVAEFNRSRQEIGGRLAVVALPCQALALHRMLAYDPAEPAWRVEPPALVIGLFCTWALDQVSFTRILAQRLNGHTIHRMDIPPPPSSVFQVFTDNGRVLELPLEVVKPHIVNACHSCPDMTAEASDISIGCVENEQDWNTLLVRTERGAELLAAAAAAGKLEILPLATTAEAHLAEASLAKRRRAILQQAPRPQPLARQEAS